MSHWTGPLLTSMFWRWGSAEVGEENRKQLEICFWNEWWGIFCFSLWIWPLCTGKVCQMRQQMPVPWGQWQPMCLPAPCLLPCLGSCALLPSPGAGPGLTEGLKTHAVCVRTALHIGILDAAGRCGGHLRVGNQTTPYWLTARPAFLTITNSSKQSWQQVKLPSLSWEMPFPFSLPHPPPPAHLVRLHAWTCPWWGIPSHSVPWDMVTCWHMWVAAIGHTGGFCAWVCSEIKRILEKW